MIENKRRLTKSELTRRREKIVSFVVMFVISVIWVLPLIYMVGTSFKSDFDLQTHPEKLFPSARSEWTLKHYTGFIVREGKIDNMPVWMFNSLWSTLATVGLTVAVDLLTAYAVVFLRFKGKDAIVKFLLVWMAVPGVIGTAPSFAIYSSMRRALNITSDVATYAYIYMWLIVPGITGIFNMLLMRNFFLSIPMDIVDSAKSDGASSMVIFRRIVCPLAKHRYADSIVYFHRQLEQSYVAATFTERSKILLEHHYRRAYGLYGRRRVVGDRHSHGNERIRSYSHSNYIYHYAKQND